MQRDNEIFKILSSKFISYFTKGQRAFWNEIQIVNYSVIIINSQLLSLQIKHATVWVDLFNYNTHYQ